MNFIIIYIVSFFVCLYVGNVFYMKSDKGLFKMIGLIPIINIIVSTIMTIYIAYVLIDIHVMDIFRRERHKKGQYNKIPRLTFN